MSTARITARVVKKKEYIKPTQMKYHLPILVVIVSLLLFSCKGKEEEIIVETTPAEVRIDASLQADAGIVMSKPEIRELSGRLACNGRVETPPSSRARISSLINGYVRQIYIYDGKLVKKGDVIALLEHPDFIQLQQDYLIEQSRYKFLSLDYERQTVLGEKSINSRKELERVRSEWEQSGVRLGSLKSMLTMVGVDSDRLNESNIKTTFGIRAPIEGYAEGISIALGQFVRPEEIIAELVNRREFLIVLQVFEKDITSVEPGQRVSFHCPDPRQQDLYNYGKVIYTGQKIDEISRTFQVYASPEKENENMRHGMMIRADIELTGVSVLTVPVEALVYSERGEYLFVREGEIFRPVRVETGLTDRGFVEIVNREVIENMEVVVKGGVYLMAEMQKE